MGDIPELPQKKALPTLSIKPVGDNPAADHGVTSFGLYQLEHSGTLEAERADKPFEEWSVDAVADWLHREKRFPEYVSAALDAEISGSVLVSMLANSKDNDEKWEDLKISKPHRLQISKAVRLFVAHAPGESDGLVAAEKKTGIAGLIGMWESSGFTPEVDEDIEEEWKELLTNVRKQQAELLTARDKVNPHRRRRRRRRRPAAGQSTGQGGCVCVPTEAIRWGQPCRSGAVDKHDGDDAAVRVRGPAAFQAEPL